MHAFDYLVLLFSFVYALAIAHVLATVGDMIVAAKRITFSWLHAGWMLAALLPVVAYWIGFWELRNLPTWSMTSVGVFFLIACLLYLETRLVCPRIPSEGTIDLDEYHLTEGRKYAGGYAALAALTLVNNWVFGHAAGVGEWIAKDAAVAPMMLAAIAAAVFKNARVQALALGVELAAWAWCFATLQSTLAG